MIVYILKLVNNKYYIGKTENLKIRLSTHLKGRGSKWTKLYNPLTLVEKISNADKFDEDKYVLKYMEKYGINNVRGGSYSQINLSTIQKINIKAQIANATDSCFNCGETNHFIKKCPNIIIEHNSDSDNTMSDSEYDLELNDICYRCGKNGHHLNDCYSKYNINGKFIRN